eukprot:Platyproteum_vivax@DN2676_c0_g1_i3.p1
MESSDEIAAGLLIRDVRKELKRKAELKQKRGRKRQKEGKVIVLFESDEEGEEEEEETKKEKKKEKDKPFRPFLPGLDCPSVKDRRQDTYYDLKPPPMCDTLKTWDHNGFDELYNK